jgi:hypothetical protein
LHAALTELTESLNYMGGTKAKQEVVQDVFGKLHRTSQQDFVRTVIVPILQLLEANWEQGWYDARNQAAADLAHKMLAAVADELYLPLI